MIAEVSASGRPSVNVPRLSLENDNGQGAGDSVTRLASITGIVDDDEVTIEAEPTDRSNMSHGGGQHCLNR